MSDPIDYGFVRVRFPIVTPRAGKEWLLLEAVESWPSAVMPSFAVLNIAPLGFLVDLTTT